MQSGDMHALCVTNFSWTHKSMTHSQGGKEVSGPIDGVTLSQAKQDMTPIQELQSSNVLG